jgi:hypothetical protein
MQVRHLFPVIVTRFAYSDRWGMGSTKGITKSGGQKDLFDKFYTKPEIAKLFIDKVGLSNYTTIIEPSAGNGSFSKLIENCIALDLKPEAAGIKEQDWLQYVHPTKTPDEKILVIGNPPFGQQNNLAIAFINHAAKFADRVAFILPISFKKESVQNRIDLSMRLVYEEDLPKNSFTFNGTEYDVRSIFQIWDNKSEPRTKNEKTGMSSNVLFEYVKKSDSPDAAIQRIGGNAGRASSLWTDKSTSSNYFIKFKDIANQQQIDFLIDELNKITYPSRDYAVGPRSISKNELNKEIDQVFAGK